ncbi:hypothetical protein [Paracoccus tegillarcae]|uniref:hypothetical protein n=1 Tax=Paracoccus tegillarcae TaxID=1529068 RepID=UPI001300B87F|nr:hypothetical protein [Paracoccus tegillarcae]
MIKSEDELFRLFGGDDPTKPGSSERTFTTIQLELEDRKAFDRYRGDPEKSPQQNIVAARKLIKKVNLTDPSRHYLLVGGKREVRVDQSRLLTVGRAMSEPALSVRYLGSASPM